MRCKKHAADLTSTVGVCATCLRERLLLFVAAQSHPHHPQLARQHSAADDGRKSDTQPPPPLLFPRSVSPYVARRKSDDTSRNFLRFYSTPQVGPSSAAFTSSAAFRSKQRRFSLLSSLFRSRSEKLNPDPSAPAAAVPSRNSSDASSSSPSWFSNFFASPQRKKHSRENSAAAGRKPRRRMDRGMSPARDANCEENFGYSRGSSPDSSQWWKKTPARRGKGGHVSGFALCLSPLVRASPNRHWNQKVGLPPDLGYSGEVRTAAKPHLSTAASFLREPVKEAVRFGKSQSQPLIKRSVRI